MSDQEVHLVAADDAQKPVFQNLIQLYLYDMATQSEFPLDAMGRYEYDCLDRFWEHPYLVKRNGVIVGFCLVISHCPIRERTPCWFIAEFCILRPYQRSGVGRAALNSVLEKHPGDWEISWGTDNEPANGFWRAVLPDLSDSRSVSFDGADWTSVAFTA